MHRTLWLSLSWTCVALGFVGAFLPLIPTTPFLLVAAWAARKSSPALGRWLEEHRFFGPSLKSWHEQGAISTRAKALAVIMLAIAWGVLVQQHLSATVLLATGALFLGLGGWLVTRPTPEDET